MNTESLTVLAFDSSCFLYVCFRLSGKWASSRCDAL